MIPIAVSLGKSQSNKHMPAIAPAPASEDKKDVISVSTFWAHTLAHKHTHKVNRAPKGEMNTEWKRVIQSREWDADETPTPDWKRGSVREGKTEDEMERQNEGARREYQSIWLFICCVTIINEISLSSKVKLDSLCSLVTSFPSRFGYCCVTVFIFFLRRFLNDVLGCFTSVPSMIWLLNHITFLQYCSNSQPSNVV